MVVPRLLLKISAAQYRPPRCLETHERTLAMTKTVPYGEHALTVSDEMICRRLAAPRTTQADDPSTERAWTDPAGQAHGVWVLTDTGLRVLIVPADEAAVTDREARQLWAEEF